MNNRLFLQSIAGFSRSFQRLEFTPFPWTWFYLPFGSQSQPIFLKEARACLLSLRRAPKISHLVLACPGSQQAIFSLIAPSVGGLSGHSLCIHDLPGEFRWGKPPWHGSSGRCAENVSENHVMCSPGKGCNFGHFVNRRGRYVAFGIAGPVKKMDCIPIQSGDFQLMKF